MLNLKHLALKSEFLLHFVIFYIKRYLYAAYIPGCPIYGPGASYSQVRHIVRKLR